MKRYSCFALFALLLAACASDKKVEVLVANPWDMERTNEIVEIGHNAVLAKLGLALGEQFVITDEASGEVPYQIAFNPDSPTDSLLIFPVSVSAKGSSTYTIRKGTPTKTESKVYGRLVPERKDDFTWENDKMAFRVYGPALEASGEVSSGIDVWAKRTDKPVIDKWYADELAGIASYHTDNGEGLDFYKVGPTLGAGAAAPYSKDSLWYSKNFTSCDVLNNGPFRLTVQLNYAPYMADELEVTPTRIISLDAGNLLNKLWVKYESGGASTLPVATGLITRGQPDEAVHIDTAGQFATYKEPADSINGTLYTAFVGLKPFESIELKNRHILGIQTARSGHFCVYYAGGGWSKGGFATYDAWNKYVADFAAKLRNPLQITLK